MLDVAALKRKKQDDFIEKRTIIEQEVDKFLASISEMDADIKEKCNYDPNYSAKTLLPALWVEPFDEEAYNQQLSRLQNYIAGVKSICDKLNEEALKCLQS